jgi:hypothetical protein
MGGYLIAHSGSDPVDQRSSAPRVRGSFARFDGAFPGGLESCSAGRVVEVLFVAPPLVFASLFIGPSLLDLAFPTGLVLMVLLSVLVTSQVASDGRSDWLKGAQLLAVYLILGLTYFFMPGASSH